jgi:hypothetical protein
MDGDDMDVDELLERLAVEVQRRYYGKYRGIVADNADPDKRGRLRLRVPSVLAEEVTDWALPCMPYGGRGGQGTFLVPDVDARVWVEFEEGLLNAPVWVGTYWPEGDTPPGANDPGTSPTRALGTASGHLLQFVDTDDGRQVELRHAAGACLRMDDSGTVTVAEPGGGTVVLDADSGGLRAEDANGNRIELSSDGIVVEDASGGRITLGSAGLVLHCTKIVLDASVVELGGSGGEALLKGQSFLQMFATHVHPAAPAPTGPPTPPPLPTALSVGVRTT